ncbi:MAG TPA: alpha-2-macroglobulin, partial [Verrucomicrobiales bacterium]|nr:alpha-2-macroglobulin [Verrucomicrobiales bacterium]
RATVDGYAVRANPSNRLPRPGDSVRIEFRAEDANQLPVSVTGEVKITREYWWEVWRDSVGREISGDELKRRREASPVWPPAVDLGMKEWTLESRGYRSDAVSTHQVATGTNGIGELKFTPAKDGYFRIAWESPDVWALAGSRQSVTNRIRAECAVWATTGAAELGYRTEGLEIVVDRESFRVGEKAPVMVVTSNPGQWVWLSVDADGLVGQQVFQMMGTTRLVQLDVVERMVPNCFLQAASVTDRKLWRDSKSVVVPPVKNFLTVEITPDQAEHRPGSDGSLNVTTRDWTGEPVAAEVAVSLVDESVFYIQNTLAPDPRQFFFGDRRWSSPSLGSSFDTGVYRRFYRAADGSVRDRDEPEIRGASGLSAGVGGVEISERLMFNAAAPKVAMDSLSLAESPALGQRFGLMPAAMPGRVVITGSLQPEPVAVRQDFRATAFWKPNVVTDKDGKGSVSFRYPDSTTRWQARGVACTSGNQVGLGTNSVATRLPLTVRLQTPRFLTTGDTAIISANLNNNTESPLTVTPTLAAQGVVIAGIVKQGQVNTGPAESVTVPAGGEARVDWQVRAEQSGEAKFTVVAKSPTLSDAMERRLPVVEYGLEQRVARSGKATTDVTIKLALPERRVGPTDFTVTVTPSLAVAMLDALPYLADYPYGCTEQTLSRFLPAVVVRKTLRDLGLDAETVMARTFGGIATNAAGQVSPRLGAKKDLLKLDDMVAAGLQRLYSFQHGNGAWGWWAEGPDDAWMTAYVLWGLRVAQAAGVVVEAERLDRADRWLVEHLATFDSAPDQAAWALHALASGRTQPGRPAIRDLERRAFDRAFSRRADLSAYSQALLALAAQRFGLTESAQTLADALSASAVRDDAPDSSVLYGGALPGASTQATAHWGRTDATWRWSDNGVESTAFVVRALLAASPQSPSISPAVTWLLKNRRGASWSNTRATAITLLALTDYLRTSDELKGEFTFEVQVNGRSLATHSVKPGDALSAPFQLGVPESALVAGTNTVTLLHRSGMAPMYFSVEAKFFNQENPIPPAATDLFVRREYFRLVPVPTLLDGVIDERAPLRGSESIASGDRLEARVILETKNDLEYVLVEDLKPAGLEALSVQSGYSLSAQEVKAEAARRLQSTANASLLDEDRTGRSEGLYVEWRDRRAAIFAGRLPAGVWEILIPYRAETPGQFAALPAVGEAMYAPEIRGNSVGRTLEIREATSE